MSSEGLINIYRSLVRPCFDYASVVYHSMLSKSLSEDLEKQQRRILKIIYGFDLSYRKALEKSGLERLDVCRSALRERFMIKLSKNDCFKEWLPLNETPVYSLRYTAKYAELPFCTERLRGALIYSFRCVLNFLESEKEADA